MFNNKKNVSYLDSDEGNIMSFSNARTHNARKRARAIQIDVNHLAVPP